VKRVLCTAALLIGLGVWSFAQGEDPDSMFEEPVMKEAQPAATPETAPEQALLISPKVEWGGTFKTETLAEWGWDGYPRTTDTLGAESAALEAQIAADLFFDARPAADFRVFGKGKASYDYRPATGTFTWDTRIFELFSDFNWTDRLFFRVGKHTIRWGVGYFFSPADVLNLVPIDPADPTADRDGPVSLKTHVPFGHNNAYLYLVANDIRRPDQLAVAPKLELVLGGWELGLGGFYQKDLAPKAMLTLTGPLAKLDLFGEAVLQYGSDRAYIRAGAPYEIYTIDEEPVFSATIGARYLGADRKLAFSAQYFFNGTGYESFSPTLAAVAALAVTAGDLKAADLLSRGRHYLAASASWSEMGGSDFGLALLYLANLEDSSGIVQPSVSWTPVDYAALRLRLGLPYGEAGDEFTPAGTKPSVSLQVIFGNGRF